MHSCYAAWPLIVLIGTAADLIIVAGNHCEPGHDRMPGSLMSSYLTPIEIGFNDHWGFAATFAASELPAQAGLLCCAMIQRLFHNLVLKGHCFSRAADEA
jgi:hypothetical protein